MIGDRFSEINFEPRMGVTFAKGCQQEDGMKNMRTQTLSLKPAMAAAISLAHEYVERKGTDKTGLIADR
ncbi:MAG TPA: hypothetical protein PKZ24_01100 [Nitrospirales bacterium]|nr:hypothetical protein [Nitrospirales bacterium]